MDSDTEARDPRVPLSEMGQCAVSPRVNPRRLIDERIDYHNRMSNGLHALLRQMPAEMSVQAEDALAQLIIESKPKW